MDFATAESVRGKSPLATELHRIPGVKGVFLADDFLTVTKADEETSWAVIKPEVFATVMDYLSAGRSVLADDAAHAADALEVEYEVSRGEPLRLLYVSFSLQLRARCWVRLMRHST